MVVVYIEVVGVIVEFGSVIVVCYIVVVGSRGIVVGDSIIVEVFFIIFNVSKNVVGCSIGSCVFGNSYFISRNVVDFVGECVVSCFFRVVFYMCEVIYVWVGFGI